MATRLPSPTALRVLQAIADGTQYGFDIIDATGLPSGTVYPALTRLEDQGLVVSRWESRRAAHREKRPARRNYAVTTDGQRTLTAAAEAYRQLASDARATLRRQGWLTKGSRG